MFSQIPSFAFCPPSHSGQAGPVIGLAGPTVHLERNLNEIAVATYIEDPRQVVISIHSYPPRRR